MKTTLTLALTFLLVTGSLWADSLTGTWTKKNHSIKGTWTIENQVVALKDFSTKSAPDLKIFLSPLEPHELTNKNATKGARLVAKLKSTKGNQSYALPEGVDLTKYKSIIIHCQRYSKLWSVASL